MGDLLTKVSRKSKFVVGIDLALKMVLGTKKRLGRSMKRAVLWADGEYLPFRQRSFQKIFAITVVLDPQSVSQTIDEARRTLSSEGLAIVSVIRKAKGFQLTELVIEENLRGWKVKKMQLGPDIGWVAKKASPVD